MSSTLNLRYLSGFKGQKSLYLRSTLREKRWFLNESCVEISRLGKNADFLLQSLVIMVSQFLVLVARMKISTAVYILLVVVKYSRS